MPPRETEGDYLTTSAFLRIEGENVTLSFPAIFRFAMSWPRLFLTSGIDEGEAPSTILSPVSACHSPCSSGILVMPRSAYGMIHGFVVPTGTLVFASAYAAASASFQPVIPALFS